MWVYILLFGVAFLCVYRFVPSDVVVLRFRTFYHLNQQLPPRRRLCALLLSVYEQLYCRSIILRHLR